MVSFQLPLKMGKVFIEMCFRPHTQSENDLYEWLILDWPTMILMTVYRSGTMTHFV